MRHNGTAKRDYFSKKPYSEFKRKPHSEKVFQVRPCLDCQGHFTQRSGFHQRCDPCRTIRKNQRDARYWEAYRAKAKARADAMLAAKLIPQTCQTCKATFAPTKSNQRWCSKDCWPSIVALKAGNGQNTQYRIGYMTPSEYAFMRIMGDRGYKLKYLGFTTARLFRFNGTSYTPDFIDEKQKIYYEVIGTRQAYHANKHKYVEFRERYPHLTLHIVKPDGSPVEVST